MVPQAAATNVPNATAVPVGAAAMVPLVPVEADATNVPVEAVPVVPEAAATNVPEAAAVPGRRPQ